MKHRAYIAKYVVILILIHSIIISSSCGSNENKSNNTKTDITYKGIFINTGDLKIARGYQTETLLPDGKVLITGGANENSVIASSELYNPITGTFDTTGSLNTPRIYHTATLLRNGKVLIVGGSLETASMTSDKEIGLLSSTELYEPYHRNIFQIWLSE